MQQRQTDLVPAVYEAFLLEGVDLEWNGFSVSLNYQLRRQIHSQFIAVGRADFPEKLLNNLRRQPNREQAIIEAIIEKDVRIRWRENAAEPVVFERPRRVLAR